MPKRAFVPAPLIQAQPRVYKSFRGRQLQGILLALVGAFLSLALFGAKDFTGYACMFLTALPGFLYGYYQPQGQPVEYWLRVLWRFYTSPQRVSPVPGSPFQAVHRLRLQTCVAWQAAKTCLKRDGRVARV